MKINKGNDTRNKSNKEEKREKRSRFVEREESLNTQADYVLSLIAREKCDHETRIRMMRVIAKAYGLDNKHVNDVLRGNVEHSGQTVPLNHVKLEDIDEGLLHLQKMFTEFTRFKINQNLMQKIESVVSSCLLIFLNRDNPKAMASLGLQFIVDQVHAHNKSLFEFATQLIRIVVHSVETLSEDDIHTANSEQAGICVNGDTITVNKITSLLRRPLVTHAKVLCSLLCTLGYLEDVEWSYAGFEIFTAKAFTGERTNFVDLMDMCLEATLYFINTGYACFSTLSLRPLFITSSLMYELEMSVDKLDIDTMNYKIGCGSVEVDTSELLARTYRLINDVQASFHNMKPIEKPVAIRLSKKLQHIESVITTTIRGQCVRVAPYCVKTYGRSGVGKTSFNNIIMYEVLRMNGFPCSTQNIAKIEPTDKFWSNVTNTTMGITIDDMANTLATKAKEDPVQLLIMLCNNQPQMVPRAEVDEKGTVFVQAKYVGITTNYRSLAAEHWSVEPMSALRRCHLHIDVTVKAKYCTIDNRLDPVLAAAAPRNGYIQDLWDIDVFEIGLDKKKPKTTQCEQYVFRPVMFNGKMLKKTDIFTLLRFIQTHSRNYFENQNAMLKSQDMVSNMPAVCPECTAITENCKCVHNINAKPTEQSGFLVTGLSLLTFISTMGGVFGAISAFLWKAILPAVLDDTMMKFYSTFRILFQPNYFERIVIKQFVAGTRTHCTAASIDLFHKYIDFNMSVLPTWLTHSHWATCIYFYVHRHSITCSWYGYHTVLTILMCLFISGYMFFIELEKGMIIHHGGYMRIGVAKEGRYLLLVCYYGVSLLSFVCANINFCIHHNIIHYICNKMQLYLAWLHYYDICVLGWLLYLLHFEMSWYTFLSMVGILVLFYSALIISVIYDRIACLYVKLQNARCDESPGSIFKKWEFPTYGQFCVNRRTPVGRIINTTNIMTLVALLGVMRVALRTYRLLILTRDQGGALSCDSVTQAEERETKTNIWDNARTFISLPGTFGVDGAINRIKKNLVYVTITQATTPKGVIYPNTYCAAIMVKGKIMLLPYHMLHERLNGVWLHKYITFVMVVTRSPSNNGWKEHITVSHTHRFGETDIVAIPTYGGGSFKDITNLYPTESGYSGVTTTITRKQDGNIHTSNSHIPLHTAIVHKRYTRDDITMDWKGVYIHKEVPWVNGDCMSVTVTRTSQPRLVGMHLLGHVVSEDTTIGCSITLTQRQINDFLQELPNGFIKYTPGEIKSSVHGIDIPYHTAIDHRSPVNFVEQSNYTVLGSIGTSATYVSKVRPSKAAEYFAAIGLGPQRWGPPKFRGVTGRENWAPWYNHLNTVGQVATCVPDDVLEIAIDDYKRPLLPLIRLHHAKVKVLTEIETVNGFEGSRFLTGLNKKTSMGFPYGGVKERHLLSCGISPTGKPLFNFPSDIWEKWYDMEKQILAGIVPITIFKATLKDEPTKLDKDKVRVFQAADIVFQLGIRKYFLPIIRVLCLHPLVSECAVGINPFSQEWAALHEHVTQHGDNNIVAGDYKSWDMLLPSKLVHHCMNLLVDLVDTTHLYSENDILIMRGICAILADPLVHLNGTLIRYHGTVPSGHNLTSILNSVCNSILLRCCFYRLNSPILNFRSFCAPITYGDDFMMGVARDKVVFGLDKYAQFLDSEVGIKVTMPDKSSNIVPYMSIDQVDFLKRKSMFIPALNTHIGVLDINSIHKSLYTTTCNKFDEDNILCAVLESAMHELFYHGQDIYDRYITIFAHMLTDLDIFTNMIFKSYEQRVDEWHTKYVDANPHIFALDDGRAVVTLADDVLLGGPEKTATWDEEQVEPEPCSLDLKQRLTNINKTREYSDANTIKHGRQLPDTIVEQAGINTEPENVNNNLLQFDTHDGPAHVVRGLRDGTFDVIHNQEHALQDALKRPVPIYNTTWPVNGEIPYTNINLVGAWISNSRFVREKVSNYRYLRGTFCVKVTVNGSPFMYGKSILSSQYWPDMAGTSELTLTQATSLPYISIMPCNGVAGCMSIPILHPHGHLALTTLTTPIRLVLQTMNPLRTVQDALDPVHVTVWAWMSDYVLSVPTSLPVNQGWEQGGDEYKQPIASTTATALSTLAGIARNVPYIGPYARASEIACSAVGNIAQIFGFSKPASIIETRIAKIKPISDLANSNGGDCSTKLSLDIKQEVTVDSSVTGFDGNDDMLIHNIAKREAYLTSFSFSTSNGVNTMIWKGVVSPCIMRQFVGAFVRDQSVRLYSVTPLAHVSLPFQYWRGTLKYRFEIIASPFHKGKIRFLHEPSVQADDPTASWTDDTTLAPSYVVDLALQREFVMELKWCHHSNYLRTTIVKDLNTETTNERMFETDPTRILDQTVDAFNGFVGVVVQEPLTCATNDNVFVNVYVSATDDFELQTLSDAHLQNMHTFNMNTVTSEPGGLEQSGVDGIPESPDNDLPTTLDILPTTNKISLTDHLAQIHFGERILSLRQLIKRYMSTHLLYATQTLIVQNGTTLYFWRLNDFPPYAGADLNGMELDVSGAKWNFASPCNLLTYFAPCFLMRRGSLRNKYLLMRNEPAFNTREWYNIVVARSTTEGYQKLEIPIQRTSINDYDAKLNYNGLTHSQLMMGAELSVPASKLSVEVELPYYNNKRWVFAQDRDINVAHNPSSGATPALRQQTFHTVTAEMNALSSATSRIAQIRRYVAAGDDFSFTCYMFPPTLIQLSVFDYKPEL